MKVQYKGFNIDAHREKSMGGETLLYYSIFRQSDGFEVTSGFSYGTDRIQTFIGYLKGTVDDFLEDPQAYGCGVTVQDTCAHCNGEGVVPCIFDAAGTDCPSCGGSGYAEESI
jgi:hypothetical protein